MSTNRQVRAGFVYDLPKLVVTQADGLSLKVPEGDRTEASFQISAEDGSFIHGRVLADTTRISFAKTEFEGRACEIVFAYSAKGLSAGPGPESHILIRSNLSETEIPVSVEVTEMPEDGEFEEVHTLDDFSKVCQRSLREGFHLFTNPGFRGILNGNNRQFLALYRGMSRNPVTYQHLEEFLAATGKKEPVVISMDRQEKAVYHLDVSQKDTLYVYRSTWGYVHLEVETEGSFLEVDKKVITGDDFIGRVYGLEYVVHRERLGDGRSFGKIRIRGVHQTIEYQIEASVRSESEIRPQTVRARNMAWILRDFLNLQLHILDYPSWAESTSMTVSGMLGENPSDVWAILYRAYLEYTREDYSKAIEVLWPVRDGTIRIRDDEQRGLYLYLAKKVELLPQEKTDILSTLKKYSARHPASYLLLRLVHEEEDLSLYTSADLMQAFENCFNAGCTSPFLYLDAWTLLSSEEALLRRLSPFMIHVLCFGAKNGKITEGLLQRAAFLCGNLKTFHPLLFRLLTKGYEKWQDDEILEAICKLAIKGNPTDPADFRWYSDAVERDIRVTRLYEYYMETYHMPATQELPLPIKMYFATNNTLGERKKALLYASIVLHKKEDETSYLNYAGTIRTFASEALKRKRIDDNYAVLYREFFLNPKDTGTAAMMAPVLFTRKITVDDPAIRRVIVCGTALKKEESAPVRDGVAYISKYTDEECVLFEDVNQIRYATSVPFTEQKLFDERDCAKTILEYGIDDPGCELCVCREKAFQMDVNQDTQAAYRAASRNSAFTDDYRDTLRRKLLAWDEEHPGEKILPDAVQASELDDYARADKAGTVAVLIRSGRYEDAFRVIEKYGAESVPVDQQRELAEDMIRTGRHPDSPVLYTMAREIFRKKAARKNVLSWLVDHPDGSVTELAALWKEASAWGIRCTSLGETILLRCVETHQFPDGETDILKDCVSRGGRQEVINAYLAYACSCYFLGHRETRSEIFAMTEDAVKRGALQYDVCGLALLKYYSGLDALDASRTALCRKLLAVMDSKGYRFDFYNGLPKNLIQAYQIDDRVFIEEQRNPECRVTIHYRLTEADGAAGEWVTEPMKNMYQGIFSKEFLLFYGETLTYYLTVVSDSGTVNTDSYELSLVDMDTEGRTKYRLLNRMLEARDKNDAAALNEAMDTYLLQDAWVKRFLSVM